MNSDALTRPCSGVAAGVPYVALPPTAVDGEGGGDTGLIVAWHGMEPPRTAAAFAAAVPMTGIPVWRVYLELPMFGSRQPAGGPAEVRARAQRDYLTQLYAPVVEQAAAELPGAVAELRDQLGLPSGPIGLTGFSAGAAAALLALAEGEVPVSAAALIAPIIAPARMLAALERRTGGSYAWTDESREIADLLDLTARGAEIVAQNPALMLVAGASDDLVSPADVAGLRDLLRAKGATEVDAATFKMRHALAAEPGTDPLPSITEAVSVDAALTDWFRTRLLTPTAPDRGPATPDQGPTWTDEDDALDHVQATPTADTPTAPFRTIPTTQPALTATLTL